jgi:hypothetical protein
MVESDKVGQPIYDSLPVSVSRSSIGRRPSVLRAFATVVGLFAISTLAYRLVVPLESASPEQWFSSKNGAAYSKLFQDLAKPSSSASASDQTSISGGASQQRQELNAVVRKLMRVAANHIRIKPPSKIRNRRSDDSPSSKGQGIVV